MIIVDPDHITRTHLRCNHLAEVTVHLFINFPHRLFINRQYREIMKQRPDRLVAKTQIKLIHQLFFDKYRFTLAHLAQLACHQVMILWGDAVAGPADPFMFGQLHALRLTAFEKRPQSTDQPPRARTGLHCAIFDANSHRHPIGYDNQTSFLFCRFFH